MSCHKTVPWPMKTFSMEELQEPEQIVWNQLSVLAMPNAVVKSDCK